jgi:hypothetical protein
VGACGCEVGRGRQDEGNEEPDEQTSEFDNVVGNRARDPKHNLFTVTYSDSEDSENGKKNFRLDGFDDDATELACAITPWAGYDNLTEDPQLIFKTKGDINGDEDDIFPKITITLRPLMSVLDYTYTGNANKSGEGEIGFESEDRGDDLYRVAYWDSGVPIPNGFTDPEGNQDVYVANFDRFAQYCLDDSDHPDGLFRRLTHYEENYWRSRDRPSTAPNPHSSQLPYEIEPTIYPRHPQNEAYNFLRNEAYDFRYRFPEGYFGKYGVIGQTQENADSGEPHFYIHYNAITLDDGSQQFLEVKLMDWGWTPYVNPPQGEEGHKTSWENPEFEPNGNAQQSDEGIAPIIKGWYWDSTTPPTKNKGMFAIVGSDNFKTVKLIRKRYPYSFRARYEEQMEIRTVDHYDWDGDGNTFVYTENGGNPQDGLAYLNRIPASYSSNRIFTGQFGNKFGNKENTFACDTYWRLEVDAELADWNSREETVIDPITGQPKKKITGAKIKGYIRLGSMQLERSYSQQGLYSTSNYFPPFGGFFGLSFQIPFNFISPSVVFRTKRRTIGFDDSGKQLWESIRYDAGTIEWEVTLTEENAKGKPIKVKDIKLSPNGIESWEENSLVFINDFVVTSVELP